MYTPIVKTNHDSHRKLQTMLPMYTKYFSLRFGTTQTNEEGYIEFNSKDSIRACREKLKMKKLFKSLAVSSPKFYTRIPLRFPCVAKTHKHSCGRGMVLLKSFIDFLKLKKKNQYYYEKFVNCEVELRCHFMGDKIFHTDIKVLKKFYKKHWIRNLNNGYKYVQVEDNSLITEELEKHILNAACSLKLIFGAADVGINLTKDTFYIFEINSAPGMRALLRKKYVKAISEYVDQDYKIKIWEE